MSESTVKYISRQNRQPAMIDNMPVGEHYDPSNPLTFFHVRDSQVSFEEESVNEALPLSLADPDVPDLFSSLAGSDGTRPSTSSAYACSRSRCRFVNDLVGTINHVITC